LVSDLPSGAHKAACGHRTNDEELRQLKDLLSKYGGWARGACMERGRW